MENLKQFIDLQSNRKTIIRENYRQLLLEGLAKSDARLEAIQNYEGEISNVLLSNDMN